MPEPLPDMLPFQLFMVLVLLFSGLKRLSIKEGLVLAIWYFLIAGILYGVLRLFGVESKVYIR